MQADTTEMLRAINAASPFDVWAGVELISAEAGRCVLSLQSKPEHAQHAGFLHAGLQAALIDRACGFAAASVAGSVTTSQFQVMCYAPAVGDRFEARAQVARAGKKQVFVTAELYAEKDGQEKLVAGGTAVLIVL